MNDKNLSYLTLAVAAVGTIVICVLAYKLNAASSTVDDIKNDPLGTLKKLI